MLATCLARATAATVEVAIRFKVFVIGYPHPPFCVGLPYENHQRYLIAKHSLIPEKATMAHPSHLYNAMYSTAMNGTLAKSD